MGRPSSTDAKLNMSLDDLVKKERNSERSEGYGPAGRAPRGGGDRERPYSEGDGQERGKGKSGKRRLPPEDKAWLHTQFCFKSESEFIVKLYDTEILQLRKSKQELQGSKENAGTQQGPSEDKKSEDKKSEEKQSDDKKTDDKPDDKSDDKKTDDKPDDKSDDKQTDGKNSDDKKSDDNPDDKKPDDKKPDEKAADTKLAGGLVLVMTSGGFRTAETKIILNEALKPMALRIDGTESSRWTLISEYKTPGEVTGASSSKPFEDGMEFHVPSLVTLESVRDHMAERQKAARAAVDRSRSRGQPMPPPGNSAGLPLHHPPPHGWPPPPHAWGMPPPGWRPPLYSHAPPGMHPPPALGGHMPPPGPWAGGYRPLYPLPYGPPRPAHHGFPAPPGAAPPAPPPGARPPQQALTTAPAGPVSDDMFQ